MKITPNSISKIASARQLSLEPKKVSKFAAKKVVPLDINKINELENRIELIKSETIDLIDLKKILKNYPKQISEQSYKKIKSALDLIEKEDLNLISNVFDEIVLLFSPQQKSRNQLNSMIEELQHQREQLENSKLNLNEQLNIIKDELEKEKKIYTKKKTNCFKF